LLWAWHFPLLVTNASEAFRRARGETSGDGKLLGLHLYFVRDFTKA
jgi:hypothetical protein